MLKLELDLSILAEMSETAAKAGVKVTSLTSGFMSPGIGVLKSWQGIAEIVLRTVVLVSTSVCVRVRESMHYYPMVHE